MRSAKPFAVLSHIVYESTSATGSVGGDGPNILFNSVGHVTPTNSKVQSIQQDYEANLTRLLLNLAAIRLLQRTSTKTSASQYHSVVSS